LAVGTGGLSYDPQFFLVYFFLVNQKIYRPPLPCVPGKVYGKMGVGSVFYRMGRVLENMVYPLPKSRRPEKLFSKKKETFQ
jgi:hypothetical protein